MPRRNPSDLESSNSTSARFSGAAQKSWMAQSTDAVSHQRQLMTRPSTRQGPQDGPREVQSPSPRDTSALGNAFTSRVVTSAEPLLLSTFEGDDHDHRHQQDSCQRGLRHPDRSFVALPDQTHLDTQPDTKPTGGNFHLLPSPSPSIEPHVCESASSTRHINSTTTSANTASCDTPVFDEFRALTGSGDSARLHSRPQDSDNNFPPHPARRGSLTFDRSQSAHSAPDNSPAQSPTRHASNEIDLTQDDSMSSRNPLGVHVAPNPIILNAGHLATLCAGQIAVRSRRGDRNDIETQRLQLLLQACQNADLEYLVIHQLYCWSHLFGSLAACHLLPTANATHDVGLQILTNFLAPNTTMPREAVMWFSNFPAMLLAPGLKQKDVQTLEQKVLDSLRALAQGWNGMLASRAEQPCPPLSDEIQQSLGVNSTLLQQLVFRSLMRVSWRGEPDACMQRCERLFIDSQTSIGQIDTRAVPIQKAHVRMERVLREHLTHGSGGQQPNQPASLQHTHPTGSGQHSDGQVPNAPGNPSRPNIGLQTSQSNVVYNPYVLPISPPEQSNPFPPPVLFPGPGFGVPHSDVDVRTHGAVSVSTQHPPHHPGLRPTLPSNVQNEAQRQYFYSMQPPQMQPGVQPIYAPFHPPPHPVRSSPIQAQFGPAPAQAYAGPQFTTDFPAASPAQVVPSGPPIAQSPSLTGQGPAMGLPYPSPPIYQMPNSNVFLSSREALPVVPNPDLTAIHQAHAKSPRLVPANLNSPTSTEKCFRHPQMIFLDKTLFKKATIFKRWNFPIGEALMKKKIMKIHLPTGRAVRPAKNGSLIFRLKCVKVPDDDNLMTKDEWVVAGTSWPHGVAILLNGVNLELRKKSHHGKDLAVDITDIVRLGHNTIEATAPDMPENTRYLLGVEVDEISDEAGLRKLVKTGSYEEGKARVLKRFQNNDPDMEIFQEDITVDLTDPFTAQLFTTPVRSKLCSHDQCFDLDIFLQTRNSNDATQPCAAEAFKCPICQCDARPRELIIDGFFTQIREELDRMGKLKSVKAIQVKETGEWTIKNEQEATDDDEDDEKDKGPPPTSTTSTTTREQPTPVSKPSTAARVETVEIIDLD